MGVLAARPASLPAVLSGNVLHRIGPVLLIAAGYYAGCLIGFALRFPGSGISYFWPPTAVLTAGLLLSRPQSWPAMLAAAFAAHAGAHAQNGVAVAAWPIQFLGNLTQALLAAYIVRRYSTAALLLADLPKVLTFIIGVGVVAPAVASLIPAFVYVNQGWADDFVQAWRSRTVTNAVASLTLVPTLVLFWQYMRNRPHRVSGRRVAEYGLLLLGLIAIHVATTYVERTDVLGLSIALYAPAPFLLWATVRFGGGGLSFALLWTTLLAISTVSAGYGPLSGGEPADNVVGLQLMIVANAVPMMLMAGLLGQARSAHRAVVDAERQTSAILRALPDVMFLHTRDGVYLRGYAHATGDRAPVPESFVDRHIADVLPPELADAFAHAMETVTSDAPAIIEYGEDVAGVPRRFEARIIGVDSNRVLTVIRDITERWRSENALRETQLRYALATQVGGIGVWELNVGTGEIYVEGKLAETLGYADGEIGTRFEDWMACIAPGDREVVQSRLQMLANGTITGFELEFRMTHKDGSLRSIASRGAGTDSVGGKPSRLRGTYTDITERKEAARALREANDALIRTGRIAAMAELSASIAHELKQPLTAISINANACLRSLTGPRPSVDVQESLRDIVNDSRRAAQIVERTRGMFANRPVQKATLDLNDVIHDVLDIVMPHLREADVRLELELDQELPPVQADAVQMQQILLNLIVNGAEAMHDVVDRKRQLRIRSRRGRRFVVVSVRDAGRGFASAEDTRRVFEPFYTTKPAGTGLGLTISRSIVDAHRGRLWAVSNRDGGATLRFAVPIVSQRPLPKPVCAPSRRVLIVDDHAEVRASIERLLRSWGHQVAAAGDGVSAIAVATSFQPEFAVVDLSLGDTTGVELGPRLRRVSANGQLRLIALTAYRDAALRERCLASGFDEYLVKPGDIAQLERLLAKPHATV